MFSRGLSGSVLGRSEHREMPREIAELFNSVWTLSLCAVCHTAMRKVQRGMFSLSASNSVCSYHRSPKPANSLSLICACFVFETRQKNMEQIFISVRFKTAVSCDLDVRNRRLKKNSVRGVYCKVMTTKLHISARRQVFGANKHSCCDHIWTRLRKELRLILTHKYYSFTYNLPCAQWFSLFTETLMQQSFFCTSLLQNENYRHISEAWNEIFPPFRH